MNEWNIGASQIRGTFFRGTLKGGYGGYIRFRVQGLMVSQNQGYRFGGHHNKDNSILGSLSGSPYFSETRAWGSGV